MIWRHECFQSGSQIVTNGETGRPWFYISARIRDESEDSRVRSGMARDLVEYLNGISDRPQWLDDMERSSEDRLTGVDGFGIEAAGPMYDANPPRCHWNRREDKQARAMRKEIIDLLDPPESVETLGEDQP